ncbi:MAG TPA: NAD-dependent epimerase/dehydratase family protein [Solirubrobacteraceae bacterium]
MRKATSPGEHRFLVTGAYGCIGAWVLRDLLSAGAQVVAADLAEGSPRLALVLEDEHDENLTREVVDVTDLLALEQLLDRHGITRIIHLAALQVPFCRADPPLGAAVNVVGTVNVFEAARRRRETIGHVVYASSIAAYDSPNGVPEASMADVPGTLYGIYKRATEHTAMRYWIDDSLASIGLRPHTVYGPARDQGLTSAPTMAMLAAAAERPYEIPYGGRAQFQYAPDVARAFVQAALAEPRSAAVHNLRGTPCSVAEVVDAIIAASPGAEGSISWTETTLAFPPTVESDGLDASIGRLEETPLSVGVADTIARFRVALADHRLDPSILDGQEVAAP